MTTWICAIFFDALIIVQTVCGPLLRGDVAGTLRGLEKVLVFGDAATQHVTRNCTWFTELCNDERYTYPNSFNTCLS